MNTFLANAEPHQEGSWEALTAKPLTHLLNLFKFFKLNNCSKRKNIKITQNTQKCFWIIFDSRFPVKPLALALSQYQCCLTGIRRKGLWFSHVRCYRSISYITIWYRIRTLVVMNRAAGKNAGLETPAFPNPPEQIALDDEPCH